MTVSSVLRLAAGDSVRFNVDLSNGDGLSSLTYQLQSADGRDVGPEVFVAGVGPASDGQQVDSFDAAALTGGGFVMVFDGRPPFFGASEALTAIVKSPQGDAFYQMPLGVRFGDATTISNPDVISLSGDGFAILYEQHDGAEVAQHLALPTQGTFLDIALPGAPVSLSTADGNLALKFASGSMVLAGGGARSTLTGGSGSDTIFAGAQGDVIRAGEGGDSIQGSSAFDDINGNQGNDVIDGGSGGGDWLLGGQGDDLIRAHAGSNILCGTVGNDSLNGGSGDEVLRGGQDNDQVSGGAGSDWLSGDRGSDTLTGGSGADTFHSFGSAGLDVINDFNAAEGDRIHLDPGSSFAIEQSGPDAVIRIGLAADGDGLVILRNVQLDALPPGFIFMG
jgi:hypothetical protein